MFRRSLAPGWGLHARDECGKNALQSHPFAECYQSFYKALRRAGQPKREPCVIVGRQNMGIVAAGLAVPSWRARSNVRSVWHHRRP
mmetsp:Transcript_13523/g.25792  ORF Transcript_13523/g.25792 Transcript_13523/m.25792 type:complete len:86 (+) Transcript_13523:258-515(+)